MASKTGTLATDTAAEPAAAAAVVSHRISATTERGFYRAGRHWPREGVDVDRFEFTDEQWAALEAEPLLVIAAL